MEKSEAVRLVRLGYEQLTLQENQRVVKAFKEHPELVLLDGYIDKDERY